MYNTCWNIQWSGSLPFNWRQTVESLGNTVCRTPESNFRNLRRDNFRGLSLRGAKCAIEIRGTACQYLETSVCMCRRLDFRHRVLTGCWTPNWCPRVWVGRRGRAPIYLCCWPEGVSRWTPCSAWNPGPPGIPPWHLNTQPAWVLTCWLCAGRDFASNVFVKFRQDTREPLIFFHIFLAFNIIREIWTTRQDTREPLIFFNISLIFNIINNLCVLEKRQCI